MHDPTASLPLVVAPPRESYPSHVPCNAQQEVVLIVVVSANKLRNMRKERGNTVAGTLAQCTAVAAAASTVLQQELLLLLLNTPWA
jgi:hypothetical protein